MRTLVKNGTIVTAESEYKADILIVDEKITSIGTNLEGPFDRILDAEGKYVLPGGVDNHAHFEALNTDGITTNEPYATTWVALQGGTTTIVDFCTNEPGMNLVDSVNYRLNVRAKGKVAPDIAIHACCNDFTDETVGEIKKLVEMGVPTMKLFLAYKGTSLYMDDSKLLACLEEAGKQGMTMMVHAENPDVLDKCRNDAAATGHYEPKYHYMTRPPYGEAEAVSRAIRFADAMHCPMCIVHVSYIEAGEEIRKARAEGKAVIGETCPHYLVLDKHKMDHPDWHIAARWICSPALRDKEDQDYLWKALNKDWLSICGSDNSGIPQAQKNWGWDEEHQRCDFRMVPNGCPGAGDRMNALWTYGVAAGRMTRQKFVDVCCTTPAKLNGIYPRKGTIQVGADADLVLFDPDYKGTITLETNPTGVEYNVFEGLEQIGRADTVLLRGSVVVEHGKYLGEVTEVVADGITYQGCTSGNGKFIPGKPYGLGYDLLKRS